MENKTIIQTALAILALVAIFGFIVPWLVSARDTVSCLLGFGVLILTVLAMVLIANGYFNKRTKQG